MASKNVDAVMLEASEMEVVNTIRQFGSMSRTDLARHLRVSRANITSVIGGLLDRGILQETGQGASQGGRRPVMLDINGKLGYVAGIDLGATSVDIALADMQGNLFERRTEPADVREEPEVVLGQLCNDIQEMMSRHGLKPEQLLGVGIGVPGPVAFSQGVLIAPPLMPLWEGYPIKTFVQKIFPAAQVMVDNDVNVMAIGELYAGAGREIENFIFIKIGTGIGSGIICNGQIYRGTDGCAGDVGHICVDYNGPICHCGNAGCLETMAAGPAIAARGQQAAELGKSEFLAQRLAENNEITAIDVGRAAANGDRVANEIIKESGRMIGGMLAGLVNFYNPKLILIGGGVSKIGFKLLSSIRQAVLRRSTALSTKGLRIELSQLGDDAGVTGGIKLALENVFVIRD